MRVAWHHRIASATVAILALVAAPARPTHAETAVRFRAPHANEELVLFGVGPSGFLRSGELDLLGELMRCRRTGRAHRIHPALARTLVQIARHFDAPVVVLSGFRARPIHGRRRSYHLRGMAADVSVEGVSPAAVREYAMSVGVRGVGYYPRSGFVHVDVRPERYSWVDASSPSGRRPSRSATSASVGGNGRSRSRGARVARASAAPSPESGHD